MIRHAQGSEGWLRERAYVITSTEASGLESKNPWNGQWEVVRQKVRALSGAPSEFKMNPAVAHGNKTEPYARAWYESEYGVEVVETGLVKHPEHSFLGASSDGLVDLDGCIEIKCPFGKKLYSVHDKDKQHYLIQIYMALECLDRDWCDFVCYFSKPGQELQVNVERVHRKKGWLEEELSCDLLPQPRKGTIKRVSLYHAWQNYIQDQFQQSALRQVHIDPLKDKSFTEVEDEEMTSLAKLMARIKEIKARNKDDLEALETLKKQKEELKHKIVDRHATSVTNGLVKIKVVTGKSPVDYKKVFEFLGGEELLKQKGRGLDSFRNEPTRRATVVEE